MSRTTVEKDWFYFDNGGSPVFLAFVNQKGNCSVRWFDAKTGQYGGLHYEKGDYLVAFREYIRQAYRLILDRQPNLEKECKKGLPAVVLEILQRQIPKGSSNGAK